jgi:hypothetical protein
MAKGRNKKSAMLQRNSWVTNSDNLLLAIRGAMPEVDDDFCTRWKIDSQIAIRLTFLMHGLLILVIGACEQDMLQKAFV